MTYIIEVEVRDSDLTIIGTRLRTRGDVRRRVIFQSGIEDVGMCAVALEKDLNDKRARLRTSRGADI